jgi:Na+-translocating ferredoxin:NAD+ oxidoreductase RnfG subunit
VAPSRTDTFDYLLILDQNFVLTKAKILIYREDYGGEISSKRWLSQFYEKPLDTQFQVGESVSGISGATISVRSMTQSVNVVFSFLKNQNILHESSD